MDEVLAKLAKNEISVEVLEQMEKDARSGNGSCS